MERDVFILFWINIVFYLDTIIEFDEGLEKIIFITMALIKTQLEYESVAVNFPYSLMENSKCSNTNDIIKSSRTESI